MQSRAALMGVLATLFTVALAGCTTPPAGAPEFKVGTIFPMTGSLAVFGPPVREAANLAAAQINAGGGAAGSQLRLIHEDSETNPAAGTAKAQKLKTDGVTAIVGADASGVSKTVYEIAKPNRIVQVSPMSTSPEFTKMMNDSAPGDRFFFRTSPSDALQGKVAGAYAIARNWSTVVVLYDNNPYGNGLRVTFTNAFQGAGGAGAALRVARAQAFEEGQTSYDSVLEQAFAGCTTSTQAACPSGVFFAGYPTEAELILTAWWANEGWRGIPWLFSEGVQDQTFFDKVTAKGIRLAGFEGTAPVGTGPGFEAFKGLLGKNPSLFQAHTYDAVLLVALAAQKANSLEGPAIRDALRAVAGPPGEKVGPADYARAVTLLKANTDIDYEGAAGSQNFDAFGDVTSSYEVYRLDAQGKFGRKCLVPEAEVIKDRVTIPASCMAAATTPPPPPPPPPAPPTPTVNRTAPDLTVTLKTCCGAPWTVDPKVLTQVSNASFNMTVKVDPGATLAHNLQLIRTLTGQWVAGTDPTLSAGMNATFLVPPLEPGSYSYYCGVGDHRTRGMEGILSVT